MTLTGGLIAPTTTARMTMSSTNIDRALLNVFREYGNQCSILFALKDRYDGAHLFGLGNEKAHRDDVLAIAEWLVSGE